MKKFFFLSALTLLIVVSASAQLAKTKWSGSMKIPQPDNSLISIPVVWEFMKDTLTVAVGDDRPEIFTFKDAKKVLTLTKVSGNSPCPEAAKVTLVYTIKKDGLAFINTISDCDTYRNSKTEEPLKKIK